MQRERRGKNVVHQLSVTLEDLYNGATRKLALQKNVICDKCEGQGGKKGAVECCPNCRGTGMQIRIHQIGPGMVQQIQSVCMECQGHGERISPKDRCKRKKKKKRRSGAARTEPAPVWDASISGAGLTCYATTLAPHKIIFSNHI
uniref:CR-type domain-containing protein n=1 Tax=Oryctolagus cuniculus TaxID=9986 RepID=A0A5F9CNW1_RABIT